MEETRASTFIALTLILSHSDDNGGAELRVTRQQPQRRRRGAGQQRGVDAVSRPRALLAALRAPGAGRTATAAVSHLLSLVGSV